MRQDCLLIDTGKIDLFDLDVANKTVTVASSMTGGRLNQLLTDSKAGLSFMGGHCPDVGLGGFLLQGGQGWGCRYAGWACENIESMRVVLPSRPDCAVTCSRTENADVFWAARGSGPGFFGVVTSFTLRLRTIPSMHGSVYFFDTDPCYDELALWYLKKCREIDGNLELVMIGFRSEHVLPHLDPPRSVLLIRPLVFDVTDKEAEDKLMEFERGMPFLGTAHNHLRVFNETSSFAIEYQRQWDDNPIGRYWTQNAWLDGPLEEVADSMRWSYHNIPSKSTFVLHYSMDTIKRPPLPKDMCFDIQSDHTFSIYSIAPPDTTSQDEACSNYVHTAFHGIDSRGPQDGGPVGIYLGDSDLAVRRARYMGDENWARFKELRQVYDPERRMVGYDGEDELPTWNKNPWELRTSL